MHTRTRDLEGTGNISKVTGHPIKWRTIKLLHKRIVGGVCHHGGGVADTEHRRKTSEADMLASNRSEVKTKEFVDEHSKQ